MSDTRKLQIFTAKHRSYIYIINNNISNIRVASSEYTYVNAVCDTYCSADVDACGRAFGESAKHNIYTNIFIYVNMYLFYISIYIGGSMEVLYVLIA